jgi:hypothetical protein
MADMQTYWQADDKSIMAKIFIMVGMFAAVMTAVAFGIGIIL